MFLAGLLLIIRRIESESCQQPVKITHDYTNCCLYGVDPPDDQHQACWKHVEVYY